MTTEEKAKKYDEIQKLVEKFYWDEEKDQETEEGSSDLCDIGEAVAHFFGYI